MNEHLRQYAYEQAVRELERATRQAAQNKRARAQDTLREAHRLYYQAGSEFTDEFFEQNLIKLFNKLYGGI